MSDYSGTSDDFGVTVTLASKLDFPAGRETVLHFFDAIRRQNPRLTEFERRDSGECLLEEERDGPTHRWVSLDGRRLALGWLNPPSLDDADAQNEWVLDAAAFHLGTGALDAESLDVQYHFDLTYQGNHDEVVAEALAGGGPFEPLAKLPSGRVLHYQPSLTVALDEQCQLQARLSVETRTSAYQVRTGNYAASPISVYFTVRQFWGKAPFASFAESYRNQRRLLDELAAEYVIPHVVVALAKRIEAGP